MMIAGLALMEAAGLFIDPVAMAQITRLNLHGVTGVLTGIYMLATGAVANTAGWRRRATNHGIAN